MDTNYPLQIKNALMREKENKHKRLRLHQHLANSYYMNYKQHTRGIYVIHSVGQGKTMTAISIAEEVRRREPDRKIIIISPKTIRHNFESTITKYFSEDALANYQFVSLNATNLYKTIDSIGQDDELIEGALFAKSKKSSLENSLIIVDEFHNLTNAISNGSSNALQLYHLIMNTKNIKLVFMSGTPIVNTAFELVPAFNMLRGRMFSAGKAHTLFPENEQEFEKYFVDVTTNTPKNMDKFKNRIFGMVSYFGTEYFAETSEGYPTILRRELVEIPMSEYQYVKYESARALERMEESKKFTSNSGSNNAQAFAKRKGAYSSYRIRSRQLSNFAPPPSAYDEKFIKHMDRIEDSELEKMSKYSPKLSMIADNIVKNPGVLHLVYTGFVEDTQYIFERLLGLRGFKNWMAYQKKITEEQDYGISGNIETPADKYFVSMSGKVKEDERSLIKKIFASRENSHGEKIQVLIISRVGAEGLDLKCVRYVHFIEPFWNDALHEQIIGRAARYMSHAWLPESERTVTPIFYLSTFPEKLRKKSKDIFTTDVNMYNSAIKHRELNDKFMHNVVEASFDCSIHHESLDDKIKKTINCFMCFPDGEPLYIPDISKDMLAPNNCKKISERQVKVHEIIVEGPSGKETYFYDDKKNVYQYSEKSHKYMPMEKSNPIYADIVRQLM